MKTTSLYRNGILCNAYIPLFLIVMFFMAMAKSEGSIVIAILGGVLLMPSLGVSIVWLCVFVTKLLSKEVLLKDYKLPLTLACVNILVLIGIFVIQILHFFFLFFYQYL